MPRYLVEKVLSGTSVVVNAERYSIHPSGALVFVNVVHLEPKGPGGRTRDVLVQAFGPGAWEGVAENNLPGQAPITDGLTIDG